MPSRRTIPVDAALLEFAVFHPFDPKAERNAEAYGPAHYAAYVIRRNAAPIGVDLGVASEIDTLIGRFRDAFCAIHHDGRIEAERARSTHA